MLTTFYQDNINTSNSSTFLFKLNSYRICPLSFVALLTQADNFMHIKLFTINLFEKVLIILIKNI